jgi:transposase
MTLRLPKPEPYEPKGWLGVDIGWNKLATSILATCNPHLTFSHPTFHGKEFKTRIIQLRRLLKEAQRKGRAVKMWRNRLRNTTKYAVGTVAKEIASKAKSLKAGVAMEKLTFKPVSKGYLVPRYKLIIAVKTLCEREGIPFRLVPAQYTSITCPKCGYADDENRNGERFNCRKCGYQADADIVGAMNIALKATDAQMEGVMRRGSSSTLKPRKASPSEVGCVAQPKAPMRDVPLKRGVSHAEQSRENTKEVQRGAEGPSKRREVQQPQPIGRVVWGCNDTKKCNNRALNPLQ